MAGYIMTLDSMESLERCINTGTYSTNLSVPTGFWKIFHEGTFADFLSMKENDNIYFFIDRRIYGIGKIVNVSTDCKYLNFINADIPNGIGEDETFEDREPILSYGSERNRCFCTFIPAPNFFRLGVDMDDVLNSAPSKFKMLRALWKLSFVKVDDEENKALHNIIIKRNEEFLNVPDMHYDYSNVEHLNVSERVNARYQFYIDNILEAAENGNKIKHEMAIEAALCGMLGHDNDTPFGKWDYISHQVVASPFKAIDYMDKMDIFGYRYIEGYDAISKYLIIEIKKDAAKEDVISQIMKYVDWVNQEYTYGDYSMIEAYIVASGFDESVIEKRNRECVRNFTKGYRPAESCIWNFVKLIKYEYIDGNLVFTEI